MGNLLVNEKQIVIPGEEIATGMDFLPSFGTYRDGESIIASRLGILSVRNRVTKVIALNGVYMPQMDDLIIGVVKDVGFSGWTIDIGSVTYANLPVGEAVRDKVELLKSDISKFYEIGDVIVTKVMNVTKSRIVQLSMRDHGLRKLQGGIIVKVVPQKIPRIIGKQGSMVGMIKDYTKCEISVGQNGFIWVYGPADKMQITKRAIKLIEEKSHISGLTDKVKEFLESESK
jgi:exosome complex component RRP4